MTLAAQTLILERGRNISIENLKAHNECQEGKLVVLLIPARTDTTWFHDIILRNNYEVRFHRGRLKFTNAYGKTTNCAPFPTMTVVMRPPIHPQVQRILQTYI